MAANVQPSACTLSDATLTTENSLSALLHRNLEDSLALKKNIEDIISSPQHTPTLQSTLVSSEIWEAVIQTYTTNILTHTMILESLEKHALHSRPEAWQDVKQMLKDAVEMVFCARRVHEHMMSVQTQGEHRSSVREQPKKPQPVPLSTTPQPPSTNKYRSPSVEEGSEGVEKLKFDIDLNSRPLPTTAVSTEPQITIIAGPSVPKGARATPTSAKAKASPTVLKAADPGVLQTPVHAKLLKKKQRDKLATNKEGLTRRQQKALSRAAGIKEQAHNQAPQAASGSSAKLHTTLNPKSTRSVSNISKRKSDVSMVDAEEGDADASMLSHASKKTRMSPPADYVPLSPPPGGEFEDISSIVDAQLSAREARKQREKLKEMGLLITEKRKRRSGESIEGFGVEVRDNAVGMAKGRPSKKLRS